jgi:hypothetical protein
MEPDTTATVMVWADVRGPAGDAQLESYQIVLEDNAAPLNGATGTVGYVDVNPHENGGDSLFIDKARSDWIFAGVPAAATPVYYGETQLGFFGVIYPNLSSAAIAPPEGIHYLASFDIQASADAMGEFTLHFVRETIPGFPRPWADLIHPYGYEYPVEEWQPLTIFVVGKSPCIEFTECADQNGDEVRDDGCTWWACDNGFCQPVAIAFADVGGSFGLCAPDGVVDGNDRFHILNCFSNQTTVGQSGYPCEANPPLALNVDAGGAFGSCAPDGVCDGNDAFHALNAFSGETACSCPAGGPAPSGPAVVKDALVRGDTAPIVDSAEIALVAGRQTMRPGELVEVDVVLASPLADLRGYQLHLGTSGGKSGALELVDISIRQPSVFTTPNDGAGLKPMRAGLKPAPTNKTGPTAPADATAPTSAATAATAPTSPIAPAAATSPSAAWSAFNLRTQQMLAGLDGPGVAAPEGAYLATFTYRASADAAGTFTVELLHDSSDRSHRTFLFPTGANGGIDIRGAASASVNVTAARDRR